VSVERRILKMVLDGLLNVLMVYAPHSGKPKEEKVRFWKEPVHLVSCIPQNEINVLAGNINEHVESSNAGYDHMGRIVLLRMELVIQIAPGSCSLQLG